MFNQDHENNLKKHPGNVEIHKYNTLEEFKLILRS